MNRTVLGHTTIACAVLGLAFVTLALLGTLRPGARADASLPRLDVSELKPGQAELRDHPLNGRLFGGFRWSVLLLRHDDGEVSAWDVPTIDGKVGMPDIHWWQPFYACDRFRLVSVEEKRYFTCTDPNVPSEYWRKEWQWSETGKALGQSVDDMQATVGSLQEPYFVIGKRT